MGTKSIYECTADEFDTITLAEAIAWLQGLASEQPCPPEDVTFQIHQRGDHYDGYSLAEVRIYRDETPEEAAATEARYAAQRAEYAARHEREQRAAYEALKAKFGE